jgi:hypothetical protein
MLSFVFVPILLDKWGSRSGPVQHNVVTTKKYGNLSETELSSLRFQRQAVRQLAGYARGQQFRNSPYAAYAERMIQSRLDQQFPVDDEWIVNAWLLAKQAESQGVQVSDKAVNDYIDRHVLCDPTMGIDKPSLTKEQVQEFLVQRQRSGLSPQMFLQAARRELLATIVSEQVSLTVSGATPVQLYDYYLRTAREARIEAIPVAVDRFLDGKDPSDRELRDFVEKYKDKEANPDSPTPGLREPKRVAVQYVKAVPSKLMDPKAVSEEAIKAYYEQHKGKYIDLETKPDIGKPEAIDPKAPVPPPAPKDVELPKMEAKPAPAKSDAAKPEAKPEPAKPEAKADAKPPAPPTPEKPKAEEKKPEEKKPEPEAKKTEPEAKKTSSTVAAPIRLVSFQEKAAKPEAAKPEEKKPEAAKPEAKPAEAKPEVAKPEAKKEPPKYLPLEKVRDQVRDAVALEQAQEKARKSLDAIYEQMLAYHGKWLDYVTQLDQKKDLAPPPMPDLEALARQYGFEHRRTDLLTAWEFRDLDIATARLPGRAGAQMTVLQNVFGTLPYVQPQAAMDLDRSYLFWKIEETPPTDPDLRDADSRKKVIEAWKMEQARTVAESKAKELAKKAQDSGKSLKDLAAEEGLTLVAPKQPFRWLEPDVLSGIRSPNSGPRWQLGDVPGIRTPGAEFMQSVFALESGAIGTAWNSPHSVVYVVKVLEYSPGEGALWQGFIRGSMQEYMQIGGQSPERAEILMAWLDRLKDDAGLKWLRKPETNASRGGGGDD